MAAHLVPTKFVVEPTSYLKCPICQNLFTDPVISVKCGHTFCRKCVTGAVGIDNKVKCPLDAVTCDLPSFAVNRAIEGQIEELEVYCKYGIRLCEDQDTYERDPSGCPQILRIGTRHNHESECPYSQVPCPHNPQRCGSFRKKELDLHVELCNYIPCPNHNKGCEFVGNSALLAEHKEVCGYRGIYSPNNTADKYKVQINELVESNKELTNTVDLLTNRVEQLDTHRMVLERQLAECLGAMSNLQRKYEDLQTRVEQMSKLRRSPSSEHRVRSVGGIQRTPSASSLGGQLSPKLETWTMPFTFKCIGTLRGHSNIVWCMCHHGNMLYSSGSGKVIKIWDLEALSKGCISTIKGHTDTVNALVSGEAGLYSGGADRSLRMWTYETGEQKGLVENAHGQAICRMVYNSDYLFTSSYSEIKVWDAANLAHIHTISGLHHWVRGLALSPNKEKLYSGSHNTIEVWDAIGKFNLKGKIDHHFGSAHAMAVTNQYIIIGTYNRNIQLYDIQTQRHLQKLSGHIGTITSIAVSPTGRFLFTGSDDHTVQIWNLENMLPIQTLSRHEGGVNSLVLHGDLLLSGSEDTEIKVFKHFKLLGHANVGVVI